MLLAYLFKFLLLFSFFLCFFFSFPKTVFATAPAITAYPSETLNLDTAFTVTATMSGLSKNATYRLRVAISQAGTSVYFGSTYDGTTWHTGSIADGNFVSITTDGNGVWGGDIQGKIDSDDPNFTTGSGTYDLKIGRYTQTGSTATWSDPKSIEITVPPTPTPTLTPAPTKTPTPTAVSTNTPTPKPTITSVLPTAVLGESTESAITVDSSLITQEVEKSDGKETKVLGEQTSNTPKILIGLGIIFLAVCGIIAFRSFRKKDRTTL